MIWHVIKKDLRSQWWLSLILIAATITYFYAFYVRPGQAMQGFDSLFVWAWPYAAGILALARFVQLDSPATKRGDWHTRPMSRWSLLAAKTCLALGGVVLPWGLIDFGLGLNWGLSPLQAFTGAAIHMSWVTGGLLLVMAIAAMTSTLVQFLLVIAGLLGGGLLILLLLTRGFAFRPDRPPMYVSPGLVLCAFGAGVFGAALVLLVLYRRRSLARAWAIMLLSTLGVELGGVVAAWFFGSNWPAIAGAEPAEARGLTVEAAKPPVVRRMNAQLGILSTPLKITKPDGVTLEIARALVQTSQQGQVRSSMVMGGTLGWDMATVVSLPNASSPTKIDAKYRLRVRRTLASIRVSGETPFTLPGGGSCRVIRGSRSLSGLDNSMTVRCLSDAPLCLDVTGGSRGPAGRLVSRCGASRIWRGVYTQDFFTTIDQLPLTITRNLRVGTIDRRFSVGWSTPVVQEFDPDRSDRPSPPVNGK